MSDPRFFPVPRAVTAREVAAWTGARLTDEDRALTRIDGIAPLDTAGPTDLAFLDNPKYVSQLATTRAAACLVQPALAGRLPVGTVGLEVAEPYRAFATAGAKLFPAAFRLEGAVDGDKGQVSPAAHVHPTAKLEPGVTVEPGAVIGARVEIGTGTVIGANAVIGHDVRIGRNCFLASNVTVIHALIGNRVILHGGVRLGQDGFGFAMGPRGHQKVPQIGRVIIQDDVEIGANTTIDRGATRDTVVGEGTKIDNLVQIAHNVVIGRHCVIVAHAAISGSTTLDDFVVVAGQVGIAGHLHIGAGAQIAAQSGVMNDIAPRARMGGSPARPVAQWAREIAVVKRLAENRPRTKPAAPKDETRDG